MVHPVKRRLGPDDWIRAALDLLIAAGVENVKIVPLASRLGVTSGSFYWHFKNRQQLLDALLGYWERELTDSAIESAKNFEGLPKERIWSLMNQVMSDGLARFDLAIWHWAQNDPVVKKTFRGVMAKRFAFAKWMFEKAGFDKDQAKARGRMMVVYMMGESTLIPVALKRRRSQLRLQYNILVDVAKDT